MNKTTILQSISENFLKLPPTCLMELQTHSIIRELPKKSILVEEGQYADDMYFIVEGSARAYYLKDGQDITDWMAFEQEFICAIQSYFSGIPSPHFIETIEPTILLEIDRKTIDDLTDKYRAFDRLGRLAVTNTMLRLQERIVSIQFETAQQKYENLLAVRSDIELRVPLIHIASYLGMTIETLSRIRKKKAYRNS